MFEATVTAVTLLGMFIVLFLGLMAAHYLIFGGYK